MLTGRYMQLPLRGATIEYLKRRFCGWRHGPPRLPPGSPCWCHGFCQRENKQNNIITLHRTTSAKTRATAMLRQHAHTAER
jgi:hypothetical protein